MHMLPQEGWSAELIEESAGSPAVGSAHRWLLRTDDGQRWLVSFDAAAGRMYWMVAPRNARTCAQAHESLMRASGMKESDLVAEA